VSAAPRIYKLHIGSSPRETRYAGSGVVPGYVRDSFAMDEWGGYLRVATWRETETLLSGRVSSRVETAVSVLAQDDAGDLVRVGEVGAIAPGEHLRAARFDRDRGYVVTFERNDPVFVLDLSQPARPAILGEVRIPGFSTYLHRLGPDHLLSVGVADVSLGVVLQLFDVQAPDHPRLLHRETVGTLAVGSEAVTNHLAFNYLAERGLLGLPVTFCQWGEGAREHTWSGLYVYEVSVERGFTGLGSVDHGTRGAECSISGKGSAVKRSVFLGDRVYSIAADRMKVQQLAHLGTDLADLPLAP
jgi:hypothetical protein